MERPNAVAWYERIHALTSQLPISVREAIHRLRLRVRPGQLAARDWASRPGVDADRYWQTTDQPHRRLLIEQLRTFESVESLLELGSHSGPNLRLAASVFPAARLGGIEINEAVVDRARELLRDEGLSRIHLTAGSVVDLLPALPDESEDLVFSCFALAYVRPGQLPSVIGHALRVARMGVVLLEPQVWEGEHAGLMRETGGWRHAYAAVMRRLGVDKHAMRIVDVPGAPSYLNACLVVDLRYQRSLAPPRGPIVRP